ncbi:MAG: hypothetical protein M3Y91_05135 [Actinomycetota bacterium]|nr:hypothetical protein [Actinomycetota bacterium]
MEKQQRVLGLTALAVAAVVTVGATFGRWVDFSSVLGGFGAPRAGLYNRSGVGTGEGQWVLAAGVTFAVVCVVAALRPRVAATAAVPAGVAGAALGHFLRVWPSELRTPWPWVALVAAFVGVVATGLLWPGRVWARALLSAGAVVTTGAALLVVHAITIHHSPHAPIVNAVFPAGW